MKERCGAPLLGLAKSIYYWNGGGGKSPSSSYWYGGGGGNGGGVGSGVGASGLNSSPNG